MRNETWNFLGKQIEAGQKLQVMIRPYVEISEIPRPIKKGENKEKKKVIIGGLNSFEFTGVFK